MIARRLLPRGAPLTPTARALGVFLGRHYGGSAPCPGCRKAVRQRQPGASSRSGPSCSCPAVRVCRMHGASGGAAEGNRNALKHERYTAEAIETGRLVRELTGQARKLTEKI